MATRVGNDQVFWEHAVQWLLSGDGLEELVDAGMELEERAKVRIMPPRKTVRHYRRRST